MRMRMGIGDSIDPLTRPISILCLKFTAVGLTEIK